MIRASLLALALVLGACVTNATADADTCPAAPDAAQLALGYDAFDAAGWRDVMARGCADAAIAQLEAYDQANHARLTPEQARELRFHVGQTLALAGRDGESIPHFERARGGDAEWAAYVDATLAFLRRNNTALAEARARYGAAANASPMRIVIIDGMAACSDAPYAQAVHCAMRHTP